MKQQYIDLDECVENALELLAKETIPRIVANYKRPLVIGSVNGAFTGRILFADKDAVFADESDYTEKLKVTKVDGAVIVSASGEKHAPILAKDLKKRKINTTLITNNPKASASKITNKTFVFPSNPEPYTYNTSTYLSMIFGKTQEKPKNILSFIKKNIQPKTKNLKKYNAYVIIVPNKFHGVIEMYRTKFDELFGPMIPGRVFTEDQMKHAKSVVVSDKECYIGLGVKNTSYGTKRINLPLPKNADHGATLAIGYWVIGQIQKQNTPWFKKNIEAYCKRASKIFGKKINPFG